MSDKRGSKSIFMPLLAVLFIGLKLAGIITWSWWWVLSPIWGPVVILIAILPIAVVLGVFK